MNVNGRGVSVVHCADRIVHPCAPLPSPSKRHGEKMLATALQKDRTALLDSIAVATRPLMPPTIMWSTVMDQPRTRMPNRIGRVSRWLIVMELTFAACNLDQPSSRSSSPLIRNISAS